MESRVSLMRVNPMRGVSMGRITNVGPVLPHDVLQNHYGDRSVQATRQDTVALRWPQCGIRTQSGTSSKGSVPARGRSAVANRIGLGAGTSRDGRWSFMRLGLETDNLQAGQRILGLRRKRTRLRRGREPTEAPCKPMRLRQFLGLVSWG
jgi:hypothetical protein